MEQASDIEPHPSGSGLDADDVDRLRRKHRSWVGFGPSVRHGCCLCDAVMTVGLNQRAWSCELGGADFELLGMGGSGVSGTISPHTHERS